MHEKLNPPSPGFKPGFNVYLFEPKGFLGWIITKVTRCKYSHSAISLIEEKTGYEHFWDASERRGYFSEAYGPELRKRRHVVFRIEDDRDMYPWVQSMLGVKYDWCGVLGWLFKANDKRKFYCFEATMSAIYYHLPYLQVYRHKRVSGCDIEDLCNALLPRRTTT